MRVIIPFAVTDAALTTTNVTEDDYAVYSAATDYAVGDYAISTTTHTVYRALVVNGPSSTVVDPDDEAADFADPLVTDPAVQTWQIIGATNRWRLFDEKPSVQTTNTTTIEATITPGEIVDAVAVINIDADDMEVLVRDNGTLITNLITYSNDFTQAVWTKSNGAISTDAVGQLFTENTATSGHGIVFFGGTTGTKKTLAIEARQATAGAKRYLQLYTTNSLTFANFDLETGEISHSGNAFAATVEDMGDGWYRCALVTDVTAAVDFVAQLANSPTSARAPSYTGDGASGMYFRRAQFTATSFLPQYIATSGATAAEYLVVYNETFPAVDNTGITDGYSYYFEPFEYLSTITAFDLPPYQNADIEVTLTKSGGVAACGQLVLGRARYLGVTSPGSSGFDGFDFSTVGTDIFGNLETTQRAATRTGRYRVAATMTKLQSIERILNLLRGGYSTVWSGATDDRIASTTYGYARDWRVDYVDTAANLAHLTIEVQGTV